MIDLQRLRRSFRYAFSGIRYAFVSQQTFRIYFLITLAVVAAGVFFEITFLEWIAIFLSIFFVFTTEMINTAFEEMVNLIKNEHDGRAKLVKDVSGGMVVLAAFFAFIVGAVIFVPKIVQLILRVD